MQMQSTPHVGPHGIIVKATRRLIAAMVRNLTLEDLLVEEGQPGAFARQPRPSRRAGRLRVVKRLLGG